MSFKFPSLYMSVGLLFFVILGIFTFSALPAGAATQSSISVSVSPENPAPGENVDITLSSYASNLDSVLISWSVNGQKSLSGIGEKSFSITAPAAGSETNVVAAISLPEGTISTKIIVRPAVMVLLWQADDSYVPPFYKGKALPTPDSKVRVVAMPEIKSGSLAVDPKNLVYSWKLDYNNDQQASGYGRNSYSYMNDYLDTSNTVSVIASTTDQKYSSEASLDLATYEPKIIFYRNDSLLGTIWDNALQNGHKITGEEILEAAPYFISPKDIRVPLLSWQWSINGNPITTAASKKNWIPLKVEEGVSGTSKVRLDITSNVKVFENASKEISVEF